MKEKHTFKGKKHDDMGTVGFVPDFNPMFEPFQGMGVAHDVLEHYWKDDTGGMQFELMATGASLFIRDEVYRAGQGAYNPNPAYSWENIFKEMFSYYNGEYGRNVLLRDKYQPYRGYTRKLDEYVESQLTQIFHNGLKLEFLKEEGILGWDKDADRETKELVKLLKATGKHWVRKGYRAVQKRFKDAKSWELGQVFRNIETTVDKLVKQREDEIEGGELIITLDTRDPENSIRIQFSSAWEIEEDMYANEENEY